MVRLASRRRLQAAPPRIAGTLRTGRAGRRAELALLDRDGVIVWVNEAWTAYCCDNGGDPGACGAGVSYLAICDSLPDEPLVAAVASAIRRAIAGELAVPEILLMPCDNLGQLCWFDLLVSSRFGADGGSVGATVVLTPSSSGDEQAAHLLRANQDRDRLIEDLHAAPLQDLFAVEVGLSAVLELPAIDSSPGLRNALTAHIDAIDTAIRRIREATTQLSPSHAAAMQHRQRGSHG